MNCIRERWHLPLLILFLLGLYLPCMTQVYLFADDYLLYTERTGSSLDYLDTYQMRDGRPVSGILVSGAFNSAQKMGDLRWARAAGFMLLAAFAVLMMMDLKRLGFMRWQTLAASLVVCSAPAWIVIVGWVSCYPYPLSAICAYLSGMSVLRGLDAKSGGARSMFLTGSILLLTFSFLIYQITTTLVVLPWIARLLAPSRANDPFNLRKALTTGAVALGVLGVSGVAGAVVSTALKGAFLQQKASGARALFALKDADDLGVAVREIATRGYAGWSGLASSPWSIFLTVLAVGMLLLAAIALTHGWRSSHVGRGMVVKLCAALALVLAPAVPLLLIDQGSYPWRIFAGTVSAGMLFLLLASFRFSNCQRLPAALRILSLSTAGLFAMGNAVSAAWHLRADFVEPNANEYDVWETWIRQNVSGPVSFMACSLPDPFAVRTEGYELSGDSSGTLGWFAKGALQTFFAEQGFVQADGKALPTVVANHLLPDSPSPCALVINGYEIMPTDLVPDSFGAHANEVQHPVFGTVRQFGPVSYFSEDFGYLFEMGGSWALHDAVGYFIASRSNGGDLIAQTTDGGCWVLRASDYPRLRSCDGESTREACGSSPKE